MQASPSPQQIDRDIKAAKQTVTDAFALRKRLRRNSQPGGLRQGELERAIERMRFAARPIRHYMGMLAWHQEAAAREFELRAVSAALRNERKKLSKMLR